jgi:hypothetical protein
MNWPSIILWGFVATALQLRYLQALSGIATDRSSFIVFPIPIDLLRPFVSANGRVAAPDQG